MTARALVQRCEGLKVNILFNFGSPNSGMYAEKILGTGFWWDVERIIMHNFLSEFIIMGMDWGAVKEYYRAFWYSDIRPESSGFLNMINNKGPVKVQAYKERLYNVKYFVLWMWDDDTMCLPKETSWFWDFDRFKRLIPLKETEMWKEDWLGLKAMYEEGRLIFYHGPGGHMDLKLYMMTDYLGPLLNGEPHLPSQY